MMLDDVIPLVAGPHKQIHLKPLHAPWARFLVNIKLLTGQVCFIISLHSVLHSVANVVTNLSFGYHEQTAAGIGRLYKKITFP